MLNQIIPLLVFLEKTLFYYFDKNNSIGTTVLQTDFKKRLIDPFVTP